tara:strand:- start:1185 stop:1373 length:189 start_codon:yes stop_codon:yes gene_type:complete
MLDQEIKEINLKDLPTIPNSRLQKMILFLYQENSSLKAKNIALEEQVEHARSISGIYKSRSK